MPLASANRAALAYIAEVTPGTTPGAGTAKNIRFTGESFSFDLSKETSKEIRADRQLPGATTVDAAASGGFNFEMQYREYDAFIAAALGGAYVVHGTDGVSATATITFATGTLTASVATSGSSIWTSLQQGQWFRVIAPGNVANNGKFFRVHATTPPTTTVITLDPATPAVAAASVANCIVQTSRLSNGTTQTAFSIERSMADVTQFMIYKGMQASKMNWKFAAGALSEGSFDFMGMGHARAAVTGLPSAPGASQAFKIQNGVRGIGQLWDGTGPLTGTFIKSLDLSVDNNLRPQNALGTLGLVGIGMGDFRVTGSYEAYFADGSLYDKFLNDTSTAITVGTQDADGNGYIVTLPNALLMSAKVMAGSKNTDIMASITFEAFADDTNAIAALRKTMFVDRVGVAGT
jgi:hypothetical protein